MSCRPRVIAIVLGLFSFPALSGCSLIPGTGIAGSGVSSTTTRPVQDFSELSLSGSGTYDVVVGEPGTALVTIDDNLQDNIILKQSGAGLEIYPDKRFRSALGLDVALTTPELDSIDLAGSGDVRVVGLDGESFDISIAGSGDVVVEGKVRHVDISIAGSGELNLSNLEAESAVVSIAGSGDLTVNVVDSLEVSIAGSGSVNYIGDPKVSKSVVGSGDINRIESR